MQHYDNEYLSFSVLISIYIKENPVFLAKALESIWDSQILKPEQIVIVKDGALTLDLDEVINDFSKNAPVRIVALPKNKGLGEALNLGLSHCKTEIVARMDSDDISSPTRFLKQINYLRIHPDIDILSSWISEFNEDLDNVISTRKVPEYHLEISNYAKKRCPVNHPSVVFKKSKVIAAGGYKPFPLFEDYNLWVRMLMAGAKFYNFQESFLLFRTNRETYKRRGGLKHSITEIKLQLMFRNIGFITSTRMIINIIIRTTIRLIPNKIRFYFYNYFLR